MAAPSSPFSLDFTRPLGGLRKRIGIGEDCGLFVWAGVIPIEPHTRAGFWDIARSSKSSLASQQSLENVAIGIKTLSDALAPGIDTYAASQILAQAFPCELLLTNLGKLPCEFDFGDLKLKALWGPAAFIGFEGEQTVGVITTNGALCLLHSSFTPLPWLLPRTERILRSVCEGEKSFEQPLLRKKSSDRDRLRRSMPHKRVSTIGARSAEGETL